MARQMMITQANRNALPALYAQDGSGMDATAYVHYFSANMDFYATEFDGENTFFGYIVNHTHGSDGEFGYFHLSTLEECASHRVFGGIERDMHFTPQTIGNVRN